MITILVPVLGREHQIKPLLKNISDVTRAKHKVVFICSPNDPAKDVCLATGAETIVVPWNPRRADFAKKINLGFSETDGDWLFQGATDLVFHPGWDRQAIKTASVHKVGVVGTNDLGNPTVKRGLHATHILFSRKYIERHGGTYDSTGAVFSEMYAHQFVDTEFVQTAILRGQFKPCLRSVVEHMHPHWGKGDMDDTYVKSEKDYHRDAALYNKRMREANKLYGKNLTPRERMKMRLRPGATRR